MQLNESYVKEIRKHLGYMAFWLPDSSYGLGTIGVIDNDGIFDPISNLEIMGISFAMEQRPGKSNIDYSSAGNVTLNAKSSGKIIPGSKLAKEDSGFVLDMGRRHSILFQANDVTTTRIKDKVHLGKEILKLYREGIWKREWVVITELKVAASTTIFISSNRNSHVELKVTGAANSPKMDIADASLGLDIVTEKGMSFKVIAEGGLTPLFRVSGISIDNITRHVAAAGRLTGLRAKGKPNVEACVTASQANGTAAGAAKLFKPGLEYRTGGVKFEADPKFPMDAVELNVEPEYPAGINEVSSFDQAIAADAGFAPLACDHFHDRKAKITACNAVKFRKQIYDRVVFKELRDIV